MNLSAPFIARPVATTLVAFGLVVAGAVAFAGLPIAPLPQVDFPTITVSAALPGAGADTMAATVAAPLERTLGSIAGVTEITSRSSAGATAVTLQFDLDRPIDGAARDVQSAIDAARKALPPELPAPPTYRKVNPAAAPVLVLSLTSATLPRERIYDAASTVLAQRLSQVEGVGQVNVGGGALPAVRVSLDVDRLSARGIDLDTVRHALSTGSAQQPLGAVESGTRRWALSADDQAATPAEVSSIVLGYRDGAAVRVADVAEVADGVQDLHTHGVADGRPSVVLFVLKQPGANIIETVERVRAALPALRAAMPRDIDVDVVIDRTTTIRAALDEVERALALAVALVIVVVLLALRDLRAALLPAVAVPASLAGAAVVMAWAGYTLDNLSAMALTIATGFVVDDAIVVLETISQRLEHGLSAQEAARRGARDIGFTVVSITVSLVAVFLPLLFMGGLVGRLFREFAVVLSAAVVVSMVVSLTLTPMMAARLLRARASGPAAGPARVTGRPGAALDRAGRAVARGYRRSLAWTLRHPAATAGVLLLVVALNVLLFVRVPKTLVPQQDNGAIVGTVQGDPSSSFEAMRDRLDRFVEVLRADAAVAKVIGYTGGGQRDAAWIYIALKPRTVRHVPIDAVVARLRERLSHEPGATLTLVPVQDIRAGGRQSNAQYEYTLLADDASTFATWEPRVREALSRLAPLADVDTDRRDRGLETRVVVDRDAAARLGVSMATVDATLYDAFGQRPVDVIQGPLAQYRVVMSLAPQALRDASTLARLSVRGTGGALVPLAAFARLESGRSPLAVNHQGGAPSTTVGFNLAPGASLSQATAAIEDTVRRLGLPASLRGDFAGTAGAFRDSQGAGVLLVCSAIAVIYLVLGILYESLVHPITILSTLPSAGVGALLALPLSGAEFSLMSLIGMILLIGLVKKNAILMVDVAIARRGGAARSAAAAIYRAARLRLRPILMTTAAALLGALPLVLGGGDGSELRRPLGVTIVGGLVASQLLTLYTTPVVFVLMDRLSAWLGRAARRGVPRLRLWRAPAR